MGSPPGGGRGPHDGVDRLAQYQRGREGGRVNLHRLGGQPGGTEPGGRFRGIVQVLHRVSLALTPGLFLLVPLSDGVRSRRLVPILPVLNAAGRAAADCAPCLGVLLTAAALLAVIPDQTPPSSQSYRALLATSLRLLRPSRSCAAWTTVSPLLTGPGYRLSTGAVTLVGAGSVFVTPLASRRIDRSGPGPVNRAGFLRLPRRHGRMGAWPARLGCARLGRRPATGRAGPAAALVLAAGRPSRQKQKSDHHCGTLRALQRPRNSTMRIVSAIIGWPGG